MSKYRTPRIRSLCVFCGSSTGRDPENREAAVRLGRILAHEKVTLVYGGGHIGMMGALAETALSGGTRVIGIIPEHLTRIEAAFLDITELHVVDSMHTRKRRMFDMADAFCVLPGGMGTMDETFEILTWKQLRLHNKPIIVVNHRGYWEPFRALFDSIISNGFASPDTARLLTIVDDVDEVLPTAQREMALVLGAESKLF